jgi:murein DD-endopeptidase MepM/ murein hydrolase activator NlpD
MRAKLMEKAGKRSAMFAACAICAAFLGGCQTAPVNGWNDANSWQHGRASHSTATYARPTNRDRRIAVAPRAVRRVAPDITPRYKPNYATAPAIESGERLSADAGNGQFCAPVSGRIIEGFGNIGNGQRNDGINIAAPAGAPIHAAADGTVSYAGNELKGYGNLILIKHDDGFVTAYAHANSIGVARGQRVSKGDVIGTVGQTGDVAQPQLHFELRQGMKPVDPRPLIVASSS